MRHASLISSYRHSPRGGAEDEQQHLLQSRIALLILPQMPDHWVWSLEVSGEFSVKSVCNLVDDTLLPMENVLMG